MQKLNNQSAKTELKPITVVTAKKTKEWKSWVNFTQTLKIILCKIIKNRIGKALNLNKPKKGQVKSSQTYWNDTHGNTS